MKMFKIWVGILVMVAVAACSGAVETAEPAEPIQINKDEAFMLRPVSGQDAAESPEGLTIRLISVEDSRCPKGVECVWAGMVSVTLEVQSAGQATQTVVLSLGDPDPASLISIELPEGHLSLVSVEPYPQAGHETPPEDQLVTLIWSDSPLG